MSTRASANTMKGILVGRAVTVTATKLYQLRRYDRSRKCWASDRERRQRFMEEAATTARILSRGLAGGLELIDKEASDPAEGERTLNYMLRALIDSGGPYWSGSLDTFFDELSPGAQAKVLKDLEAMAHRVARTLMNRAAQDCWNLIWAEAADAAGWFMDDMVEVSTKKGRLIRPDLLIRRDGRESRLIVDLKYRSELTEGSVADALDDVAEKYARPYCDSFGRRVCFSVLVYNEDDCLWSREEEFLPQAFAVGA